MYSDPHTLYSDAACIPYGTLCSGALAPTRRACAPVPPRACPHVRPRASRVACLPTRAPTCLPCGLPQVGPPGGGKTSILRALALAVGRVASAHALAASMSEGADGGLLDPCASTVSLKGASPTVSISGDHSSMSVGAEGEGGGWPGQPIPAAVAAETAAGGGEGGGGGLAYAPVRTHVLNPVAVSLDELYGAYNAATGTYGETPFTHSSSLLPPAAAPCRRFPFA
jgi:hypothetical protein